MGNEAKVIREMHNNSTEVTSLPSSSAGSPPLLGEGGRGEVEPGVRAEAGREVEGSWERLHQATLRIAAERDLPSVLSQTAEQARALAGVHCALLALPDDNGKPAHLIAAPSSPEAELDEIVRDAIGLLRQQLDLFDAVLHRRKPLRTSIPLPRPDGPSLIMALLGLPLCAGEEIIAALILADKAEGSAFSQAGVAVLKGLADFAAVAIQTARRTEQLALTNAHLLERIRQHENALAQQVVEAQQAAQSALLQEMGHRIRNSLQMAVGFLSYALMQHDADSLEDNVRRAIDRIKGLAAVQEVLAGTTAERVGFHELARRAVAVAMPEVLLGESNPLLSFEGPDVILPAEQAKSLALAVNELVINAFRHGLAERHQGHIRVLTEAGKGQARVIVRDDGRGLPQDFNPRRDRGLGITIARGLVERSLGGSLSLSRSEHGTDAVIRIPLEEEQDEITTGAHR